MDKMKPIKWMGSSRENLKAFPDDARRYAGFQLRRVQKGFNPEHYKPFKQAGQGVSEIIIEEYYGN